MIEALLMAAGSREKAGQIVFDTPGIHYWTVPSGVYSVSVVSIGAGANGTSSRGGGAGALAYGNDIPVTPGDVVEIEVGDNGANGGQSSVLGVIARGSSGINGGTFTGDGGGNGGIGGSRFTTRGGGGGAAGRYTGTGGRGARYGTDTTTTKAWTLSSGPIGERAASFSVLVPQGGSLPSPYLYAAGTRAFERHNYSELIGDWLGNVYVVSESSSTSYYNIAPTGTSGQGRGGTQSANGEGVDLYGSNTTPANNGYGYGGGATNKPGGTGAVRLIWPGDERQFPSLRVNDE